MELFARLTEIYKNYETRIETADGTDYFIIVNPFWNEDIRVSDEDGIIFFFSYQHAHFDYGNDLNENIEDLTEYINAFLDGKLVAIEFFSGETNLFGGSRNPDDIDTSSGKILLKSFAGNNKSLYKALCDQAKGFDCRCSIRGWNNSNNKDIDFVL